MKTSLQKYLEKEKFTPSAWARQIGVSQPVITRYLAGKRGLSLRSALLIQEATQGEVRAEDLVKKKMQESCQNK
jgi:DNA-binding transcriptional regulator YdaS (Cro superfamily)